MIKLFFITFLWIFSSAALAGKNNGNSLAVGKLPIDTLPKDFSQLNFKEVGSAKFSVLFWDIYNSTLYTESGSYLHKSSPDSLIFEIEYLKDITTDDLVDRTVQQWKHLDIAESEYSKFVPTLKAIWPNISSGDKLTMLLHNKQSVFYFNDVRVGGIEQKEFSKLFLDIWLSPKTSQTKLRSQLLGEIE
jgi:hypothetical protein